MPGSVSRELTLTAEPAGLVRHAVDLRLEARVFYCGVEQSHVWEVLCVQGATDQIQKFAECVSKCEEDGLYDRTILNRWADGLTVYSKWLRRPATPTLLELIRTHLGPREVVARLERGRVVYRVVHDDTKTMSALVDDLARVKPVVKIVRMVTLLEQGPDVVDDRTLLRVALNMGYYEIPKRVGIRDLAGAVGLSKSGAARRLNGVEREAVKRYLLDGIK